MEKLAHVQQTEPGLCLAACCAMLCHQSLDDVIAKSRLLISKHGLRYLPNNEAIRYLASYMLQFGTCFVFEQEDLEGDTTHINFEYDLRKYPAILTVKGPMFEATGFYHAIVYDNEQDKVLDPLLQKPSKRRDYNVIEWAPILDIGDKNCYLKPTKE